jgi:hypothetical protein
LYWEVTSFCALRVCRGFIAVLAGFGCLFFGLLWALFVLCRRMLVTNWDNIIDFGGGLGCWPGILIWYDTTIPEC